MSDQQDTDRLSTVSDRAGVDVATAARQLGITPDAVRGRLHRGTLPGERQPGGQWVVYLAPERQPESDDRLLTGEQQATTGHRQPNDSHATALVTELQADVEFLRSQLDYVRRDQAAERERFDVIHREALQRIEALTAGPEQASESVSAPHNDQPQPSGHDETAPPDPISFFDALDRWIGIKPKHDAIDAFGRRLMLMGYLGIVFALWLSAFSYVGVALTTAGRFFSWDNLGKAAIIATLVALPLAIMGIVVTIWLARRPARKTS